MDTQMAKPKFRVGETVRVADEPDLEASGLYVKSMAPFAGREVEIFRIMEYAGSFAYMFEQGGSWFNEETLIAVGEPEVSTAQLMAMLNPNKGGKSLCG